MILDIIYDTYVDKTKSGIIPLSILTSIFDYSKEVSVFDYLKDEYLQNFKPEQLAELKTALIEIILLHDSCKLHDMTFKWMKSKYLYSDLETVTSKFYDKFIQSLEKEKRLNIDEVNLVYKYLVKTNEYQRLINFLVLIIDIDTSSENCLISEGVTINLRLHYIAAVLKACEHEEQNPAQKEQAESIKKQMAQHKECLLIQSTIEDTLVKRGKDTRDANTKRETAKIIATLNSRLFTFKELMQKFTIPEELHFITITILKHIALEEGKVSETIRLEISKCYFSIMKYYAQKRSAEYPWILYDNLKNQAKEYYTNFKETTSYKLSAKNCNDEFKKAFFPCEDILKYSEVLNEEHFGTDVGSVEYFEEGLDKTKVKHGPYWCIELLLEINQDCLSYVISLLDKTFGKHLTVKSMCNIVFGIKRYHMIREAIDPYTTSVQEQDILQEYQQYSLSLKQIIKKCKEHLEVVEVRASFTEDI